MRRNDVGELRRIDGAKRESTALFAAPLGDDLVEFFNQTVRRRQTKLAGIAESWAALVPETLSDHCTLYGLSRGTLTVLVDSAVHLYELKQLLLAGLQDQLLMAYKGGGVRKIVLKPGTPTRTGKAASSRDRRCRGE